MKKNRPHRPMAAAALIILLALVAAMVQTAQCATIVLKNGEKIATEKYWEKGDVVEFIYKGLIAKILRKDIARIETEPGETPPQQPADAGTGPEIHPPAANPRPPQAVETAPPALAAPVNASPASEPAQAADTATPAPKPPTDAPLPDNAADIGPAGQTAQGQEETTPGPAGRKTDYLSRVIAVVSTYRKPVGFRGLVWDCGVTDIRGLEKIGRDPALGGIDMYRKPDDILKFGNAVITSIVYGFRENRLISITLRTRGKAGYLHLKQAAFKQFGKGRQGQKTAESTLWPGGPTDRYLAFNESDGEGLLWFRNRELWQQARGPAPATE